MTTVSKKLAACLLSVVMLLGILLLNETFTPSFLVGLVLISADVILSTLETRKLAKQAQAGSDR